MKKPHSRNRRTLRILRLFFRLMLSFSVSYGRARLSFGAYDFFADREANRKRARWLRTTALDMGGVIIKVGQFLSTRVDLLPDEFIDELALLQDEVPPVSFDDIQRVIVESFGVPVESLFARIEPKPVAAASLGQVHKAVMLSGQNVVVKVKRPHIEEIVEADLSALRVIIGQLRHWRAVRRRVDLPGILAEFTETIRDELDYVAEGHNAERIAVSFAADDRILLPRVYWSRVTRDVITLEYVPGIKVTDYAAIEQAGISRSDLADLVLRCFLKQVLDDGFFHADPHPGNLFARPGPVLVLVDFGMVGRITPRMKASLRTLFIGIVQRDFDAIVRSLVALRFIRPGADVTTIRRAITFTIDTFYEMSFAELRAVDPRDFLDQAYDVFRSDAFQVPTNFAFLGRALGTLAGLCTGLDPEFQFYTIAGPYARGLISEGSSIRGSAKLILGEARRIVESTIAIPRLTHEVLEGVGDVDWIRRDLGNVSTAIVRVERMMRALLVGLLAIGFLIAGAFLASRYNVLAIGALAITSILIIRVMLFMLTSRRPPL